MIVHSCFKGGPVILRLDLGALLFPVARLSRTICTAAQVGKLEKKEGGKRRPEKKKESLDGYAPASQH
jgi:hypothetical protein